MLDSMVILNASGRPILEKRWRLGIPRRTLDELWQARQATHGLPGGRHLRLKIGTLETPEAFFEAVDDFFEQATVAA